jgi:hypothetical protein
MRRSGARLVTSSERVLQGTTSLLVKGKPSTVFAGEFSICNCIAEEASKQAFFYAPRGSNELKAKRSVWVISGRAAHVI